jgi:anti-sigma B factor antagonist
MSAYVRIKVSPWEEGEKQVAIVELLDRKLWGPTLMQELVQELMSLLDEGEHKDILLDLSRVDFISSAALNRMINFQKRVEGAGGKLKLCGLRPSIEEIFITTRFNQLLDIHKTQDAALAAY